MVFKQQCRVNLITLVALGLVVMVLISLLSACQSPAPTLPTPSPTPTTPTPTMPTPAAVWAADGVIMMREYAANVQEGKYLLSWWSDAQYVYIGIRVETTGWVAVAVQPGSRMKNADMVFGFVKDGNTEVYDLFSTGDFGPHPPDTELGGTDDIIESGGSEADGYTTIEFKRALDTGDEFDIPLLPGVNKIIWAYGSGDALTLKHANRGYGEINLT